MRRQVYLGKSNASASCSARKVQNRNAKQRHQSSTSVEYPSYLFIEHSPPKQSKSSSAWVRLDGSREREGGDLVLASGEAHSGWYMGTRRVDLHEGHLSRSKELAECTDDNG